MKSIYPVDKPTETRTRLVERFGTVPSWTRLVLVMIRLLRKTNGKLTAVARLFCNTLSGGYFRRMDKRLADLDGSLNEIIKLIGRSHDIQQESIVRKFSEQNLKGR